MGNSDIKENDPFFFLMACLCRCPASWWQLKEWRDYWSSFVVPGRWGGFGTSRN